jgi:hypothetical protein
MGPFGNLPLVVEWNVHFRAMEAAFRAMEAARAMQLLDPSCVLAHLSLK